jgi:hypothetical protein
MFPEGENRTYLLFIKHLDSWADLSQDAIDLDHDLSLAIEVLRTYDAKCSVSGDAVHLRIVDQKQVIRVLPAGLPDFVRAA